jgi:Fibronectin type III domain
LNSYRTGSLYYCCCCLIRRECRAFTQLAAYAESVSGDNEIKIRSAGMDVRAAPVAGGDLEAPEGLSATVGDRDGEIDLQWNKVSRAYSYTIERSTDPPTAESWKHQAVSTRSSATVDGLTSGTKYWFRDAAVSPAGQSAWSNPVAKIAP